MQSWRFQNITWAHPGRATPTIFYPYTLTIVENRVEYYRGRLLTGLHVVLQNVISTPVSKALRIDFEPVKVPPETDKPTEVAQLTFDCKYTITHPRRYLLADERFEPNLTL